MQSKYILGIDQSTQGTKALIFDKDGVLVGRSDVAHKQFVNETGWVGHDAEEIYENVLRAVQSVVEKTGINRADIAAMGISNQRETALAWDRRSQKPVYHAIVWQCPRGEEICRRLDQAGVSEVIRKSTGLRLSPYFSAAKLAWILEHVKGAEEKAQKGELCMGTVDSFLIFRLTCGKHFKTDYSNASRTQLFNITALRWDEEICKLFGIPKNCLPEVCDSDSEFGYTDMEGFFDRPIPIRAVLGDSHGALFGQGCHNIGMIKATYGTGSSIMMNIGETPVFSDKGIVTSLAYKIDGKVNYVLEGNINYTGAVITWLQKELKMFSTAAETAAIAKQSNQTDTCYLVPAFSGLGAPYWDTHAKAALFGMTRVTGQPEIVRAGLDCIAYQIADIIRIMEKESGICITELRVDGGPTQNDYLMQFQSDILNIPTDVPYAEELSGIGAAYLAGIKHGLYEKEKLYAKRQSVRYLPSMLPQERESKCAGWAEAVSRVLT